MESTALSYKPHHVCRITDKFNNVGQRYGDYLQSDTLKEIQETKGDFDTYRGRLEREWDN